MKRLIMASVVVGGAYLPAGAQELHGVFDGRLQDQVNRAERASDVDGDGTPDLLVSLKTARRTGTGEGGVAFVSGRTLALISGPFFGDGGIGFIAGFNLAGDFNGDGVPDAMRGGVDGGLPGSMPEFRLYSGADGSTLRVFPDPGVDDWGGVCSPLGDIDQDGFDDVILGEDFGDNLFIYGGPDGHLIRAHADMGSWFCAVRSIGDLDGDCVPDYAIGTPAQSRVRVYSGATGAVLHDISGVGAPALGIDVCGVGDFDGDGVPDFAAGAALGPNSGAIAGEVLVFRGSTGEIAYRFQGEDPFSPGPANFGEGIDGGFDVNGDGVPDLIAGAPKPYNTIGSRGYINVYSLRTGTLLYSRRRRTDAFQRLEFPRFYGDLDGDGLSEWGFGDEINDEPHFGSGRIWIYRGAAGDAEQICAGEPNSTGVPARLIWNGPTRVGDERMSLRLEDGPPGETALVFYGAPQTPQPAFDGTLCLARPAFRLTPPIALDAQGAANIRIGWSSGAHTVPGPTAWTPGSTWAVQAIYLDPTGPGGTGLNTTSAWRVVPLP